MGDLPIYYCHENWLAPQPWGPGLCIEIEQVVYKDVLIEPAEQAAADPNELS